MTNTRLTLWLLLVFSTPLALAEAPGDGRRANLVSDVFQEPVPSFKGMKIEEFTPTLVRTAVGRFIIAPNLIQVFHGTRLMARITSSVPGTFSALVSTGVGVLENASVKMKFAPDSFVLFQSKRVMDISVQTSAFGDSAFDRGGLTGDLNDRGFYVSTTWMFNDAEFDAFRAKTGVFNTQHFGFDYPDSKIEPLGMMNWKVIASGLNHKPWSLKYNVAPARPLFFGLTYPRVRDANETDKQYVNSIPVQSCQTPDSDATLDLKIARFKDRALDEKFAGLSALPADARLVAMVNWAGNYVNSVDGFNAPYQLCNPALMNRFIVKAHAQNIKVIVYTGLGFMKALPTLEAKIHHLTTFVNSTATPFDGLYIDGPGMGNHLLSRLAFLRLRNHPKFGLNKFIILHSSVGSFKSAWDLRLPYDNFADYGLTWEGKGMLNEHVLRLNHPSYTPYDLLLEGGRFEAGVPLTPEQQFELGLREGFRFRVANTYKVRPDDGKGIPDKAVFPFSAYNLRLSNLLRMVRDPSSIGAHSGALIEKASKIAEPGMTHFFKNGHGWSYTDSLLDGSLTRLLRPADLASSTVYIYREQLKDLKKLPIRVREFSSSGALRVEWNYFYEPGKPVRVVRKDFDATADLDEPTEE